MVSCEFVDDAKYFRIDTTTGQLRTVLPIVSSTPCLLAFEIKVLHCFRNLVNYPPFAR